MSLICNSTPVGPDNTAPLGVRLTTRRGLDFCNEAQAPTAEMDETPPSIKKSAPTTYAESSDAR
jgi:hypothetical protein